MSATLHTLATLRRQFEEASHRYGDLCSTMIVSTDGISPWPLSHCLWVDRLPGRETGLGRLPVVCHPSPDEALLVDNFVTCSLENLHRDERFRQLAAEAWRATLQLPPSAWQLLRGPATEHADGGVANQMWLGGYRKSASDKIVGIDGDPETLWLLILHNLRWTQATPAVRFTWNPNQVIRDPRDARTTITFDEPASLRQWLPQYSDMIVLPLERFGSRLPCDVFLESVLAIDRLTETGGRRGDLPEKPAELRVSEAAELLAEQVGISLGTAKTRVSRAADDEDFTTNGKKGHGRRIDRDSFSTWLLDQLEEDREGADAWASGMVPDRS